MERVVVPVSARRRSEWVRGEQLLLPRLAARERVDLLHSLGSTSPARGRFRRVTTIHDVIYRIQPEAHTPLRARVMSVLVPLSARRSNRIIVPSESTRSDLVELLHVPGSKIDVTPLGLGAHVVEPTDAEQLRVRLALDRRAVLLTTSAKRPHKNLSRLLDALALLPSGNRPILVLTGYATPHETELRDRASGLELEPDTRFLGWVSPADLEGLYALATGFVFPSLYEGFGLPILEAMARRVPVACSNRGALAEVAGNAARLFDPTSPRSIADAIEALLWDADERERLSLLGEERARHFSWAETARGTLASYERALAG